MKKLLIGLVAAALLPMATPAMAKNMCIAIGGTNVLFKGVKALKPRAIVPLYGVYDVGGDNHVINGSAVVLGNGTVNYSFMVTSVGSNGSSNNFMMWVYGADRKTLAGSGGYDSSGSMVQDGAYSVTAVDCKTLPAF